MDSQKDSENLDFLVDTHCHLNYDYSPKRTEDLVEEAKLHGVSHLITIGTEIPTMPEVQAISERFENVYHTVGVHPHEAKTLGASELNQLKEWASHPKCRAIGEIGLDYYYEHSEKEIQILALEQQLELARNLQLPVIIHSRDAEPELLKSLTAHCKKLPSGALPGVIHCFSGSTHFGKSCVDLGFFLSFSGILTFKKSDSLRETAKEFPIQSLLVETDSPYLAPVPFRGKKCEPFMVAKTAETLATTLNLSLDEVKRETSRNALRLFQIQ